MRSHRCIVLIIILLSIIFQRCNVDDICLSNQHAVRAYFMLMEEKERAMVQRATIYGLGMPNDSIYKEENVTNMFLPLSFTKDTTSFLIFIQNESFRDTIHFVHTKKMNFISRECGFTFDFLIDTVYFSKMFIDSVAVINPNVRYNENVENVEIYIY